MQVQKRCGECVEDYTVPAAERECPVCGAPLEQVQAEAEAQSVQGAGPAADEFRLWLQRMAEELQLGAGAGVAFPSVHDATANGLTEEEFEGLNKLTVDENSYVLRRTVAQVGTAEVEAIAAMFSGAIPAEQPVQATIVAADPLHGESSLRNADEVSGNIAFMQRGMCTFAEKALRARDAGASAVLIAQTHDMWPYVMTDSAHTITADDAAIPVLMINRRDGETIHQALQQAAATGHRIQCKISSSEHSQECIICARNYEIGDSLVRLRCTHHYHRDCIGAWFRTHRTCPVCRYEIPKASSSNSQEPEAQTPEGLFASLASMLRNEPDPPAPEHLYG